MRLRRLIAILHTDLFSSGERGVMARSTGITAGLQAASTAVSFGSSLLYARVLGPHGFGLYAYVTAWTTLLTIPAALGTPGYLVREGAGRPEVSHSLRRWADRRIMLVGAAFALVLASLYWVPIVGRARLLFLIAAPIPMFAALGQVRQGLLRALKRVVSSQWPLVLGPFVLVSSMLGVWLWRGRLEPWEVMLAALVASALILLIGQVQLGGATKASKRAEVPSPSLKAALPFMVMGALLLANNRVDIILLGSLRGPHDAGIYAIVARAAAFVIFLSAAANMVIAPRIAALYRAGETNSLQRLLTAASRRVFFVSLPLVVLFMAAARPLLVFLYGADYAGGAWPLRILTLGYMSTLFVGFTVVVANMTGHEKATLVSIGVSLALNIVLNLVLIPLYGMNGSAVATGTSLIAFNSLQWVQVRRRIGLAPSVLGF